MNITFLASFIDQIKSWFTGWFGAILSFIPKIFYQLMSMIFAILDLLQYLVRKFAGLDSMAATSFAAEHANASGDLALYMINLIFFGGTVLTTVFWSMIILGVFMLALTTFIAVIKSEYTATSAKDAAKGPILINALKGLMSFVVVPITCFFGLYLGNLILQLVDKLTNVNATRPAEDVMAKYEEVSSSDGQTTYYNYSIFGIKIPTTNTPISGIIFQSAAYGCNRARTNAENFYAELQKGGKVSANGALYQPGQSQEYNASLIDKAFANTYKLRQKTDLDREPFEKGHMFPINLSPTIAAAESIFLGTGFEYFDKNNTALVWYYYDLWGFDYITCIAALIVVTKLLIDLALGLIKRVFELTMLFLIAAPMASLRPLDGGNASKQWTSQFVSKAIGVFGPIAGLNLFFVILSILTQIELTGFAVIDKFIQILFVIVGLVTVKDLTGMISKFVGGEDTLSSGSGISGAVAETAKKVGGTTMKFAGVAGKLAFASPVGMVGGGAARRLAKKGVKSTQGFMQRARDYFDSDVQKQHAIEEYMERNGIDSYDSAAADYNKLSDKEKAFYLSKGRKGYKERQDALKKDQKAFKNNTGRYDENSAEYKNAIETYRATHLDENGYKASEEAAKSAISKMTHADKKKLFDVADSRGKITDYDSKVNSKAEKLAIEEYERAHGKGSWNKLLKQDARRKNKQSEMYINQARDGAEAEVIKDQLSAETKAKRAATETELASFGKAKNKFDGIFRSAVFAKPEEMDAAGKELARGFLKGLKDLKDFAKESTKGIAGNMFGTTAAGLKLDEESRKKWFDDKSKKQTDKDEKRRQETTQANQNFDQAIKGFKDAMKDALRTEISRVKSDTEVRSSHRVAKAEKRRDEEMISLLQEIKTSNKDKEVIDAIKELKDALTDRDSGSGGKYTPGL